jgi:hypothetical protein
LPLDPEDPGRLGKRPREGIPSQGHAGCLVTPRFGDPRSPEFCPNRASQK